MMEAGSNDVLVVRASSECFGKQERLIPFLYGQVVKRVDPSAKIICVL